MANVPLGDRLRAEREQRGLTQDDVAQAIGLGSRVILSRYESNTRVPDAATLAKLATYYAVSVDYLLGRTEERTQGRPVSPTYLPPDLVEAIDALPAEARRVFLRAKNLTPAGLRSVVDYIKFKLEEEREKP